MTMAAALIGFGGMALGSMMMKTPKMPKIPPPTGGFSTIRAEYAGEAEKQRRRRRKGYGSTILAGGQTLGEAATQRKTILG